MRDNKKLIIFFVFLNLIEISLVLIFLKLIIDLIQDSINERSVNYFIIFIFFITFYITILRESFYKYYINKIFLKKLSIKFTELYKYNLTKSNSSYIDKDIFFKQYKEISHKRCLKGSISKNNFILSNMKLFLIGNKFNSIPFFNGNYISFKLKNRIDNSFYILSKYRSFIDEINLINAGFYRQEIDNTKFNKLFDIYSFDNKELIDIPNVNILIDIYESQFEYYNQMINSSYIDSEKFEFDFEKKFHLRNKNPEFLLYALNNTVTIYFMGYIELNKCINIKPSYFNINNSSKLDELLNNQAELRYNIIKKIVVSIF